MLRLRLANSGMLRCGELGKMVGLTRQHVHRMAVKGLIPGAKKSKGGHFYFVNCPRLEPWVSACRIDHHDKEELYRVIVEVARTLHSRGASREELVQVLRWIRTGKWFND